MRTRTIFTLVGGAAALAAGLLGAACGGSGQAAGDERVDVVAAFYPLAYAAEQVGGDAVHVTNLTPPGAEPHDLELSVRDVGRVRAADLVLYLGGFQPALERALEGAEGRAVDLLEGAGTRRDPHVWLDPVRYAELVGRIGVELGAEERAARLAGRLRALDRELAAGLADCERRVLVTDHAAFGLLAERYGLDAVAIRGGLLPEAEATSRQLQRAVETVRELGVTTVFTETLVAPDVAETVAREAGARTLRLNPLEGLTDQELERDEDYFSVMRANLLALREGLGCR